MRTGRTADAISALRNITSAFPDFARAHNDLASLLFQAGQRQEALSHYEIAAAAAPENPDFQKMLGDIYYVESARVEDALRLYGKALALRSGDVQTRMTVGNILVGLQRFEEAEMHYRKVLEVDPQHGEAATVLRKLEDRRGERTVETGSAETIYFRAKRMAESGDMEGASRILQRLVNLHPGFGLAHNDLAVLNYRMGDKEQALSHYEAAVRLEPENIIFQKNLGDFYYVEQKRVKDALEVYVKVLEIEPEDIETLLALGNICRETQQNEDAVVFFERVLEIEPWNQAARVGLDALEPHAVQGVYTMNPQDLHAEAVRLASFGDGAGSITLLERLIETYPDFALAHNDLGVLAYQAGDKRKALVHYESAARLAPQDATFSKNLADCYWVGFGRTEDALKLYVDILKTHPEEVETLMAVGKLCQSIGQADDARAFFERVLEIEPSNTDAITGLEQATAASQAA
jgi:tetratricopeptide (TPR) repeat protein